MALPACFRLPTPSPPQHKKCSLICARHSSINLSVIQSSALMRKETKNLYFFFLSQIKQKKRPLPRATETHITLSLQHVVNTNTPSPRHKTIQEACVCQIALVTLRVSKLLKYVEESIWSYLKRLSNPSRGRRLIYQSERWRSRLVQCLRAEWTSKDKKSLVLYQYVVYIFNTLMFINTLLKIRSTIDCMAKPW